MYFESYVDQSAYFRETDNCCAAHFHRSTELMYVLEGEKRVFVDGVRYDLTAGSLLICPPFCIHLFPPAPNSLQIVVRIPPEYCKRFERIIESRVPQSLVISDQDGSLLFYVRMLQSAKNDMLFEGAVEMILGTFTERTNFFYTGSRMKRPDRIQEIVAYIDAHFREQITLARIAAAFGYSPNYFSALFKKYFRMGFSSYVNSVRVQNSLSMLKTHKISAVYFDCGFRSPQQYFLNFKRYFGCTPYEYLHATAKSEEGGTNLL